MTLIVCVESCVGGGKGFFLKYLRTASTGAVLMDDNIANILDVAQDRPRWTAFTELVCFLKHFKAQQQRAEPGPAVVFVEGSLFSDYWCLARRMTDHMRPCEVELLEDWHAYMSAIAKFDAVIYLDSDVQSHFERVVNNSKREQATISREEIADLKVVYDMAMARLPADVPTLYLPCPPNFEDNEPALAKMADAVDQFLKKKVFKEKLSRRSI